MKKGFVALFCSVFITVCGCSQSHTRDFSSAPSNPLFHFGEINHQLLLEIEKHDGQKALFISSRGGYVRDAIAIAERLSAENWSIHILGDCSSACADILLLGASEVSAVPGSFIGFHGDSLMKNYLYRSASKDVESDCFLAYQNREDDLINSAGVNRGFWREQITRLRPYNVYLRTNGDDDCDILFYDLEVDFWYPNSEQMSRLYGLDIRGELASDNIDVYRGDIERFNTYNDVIMVGDLIFKNE